MTQGRALLLAGNLVLAALFLATAIAASLPPGAVLGLGLGLGAVLLALALGLGLLERRIRLQRVHAAVNRAGRGAGRGGRTWRAGLLTLALASARRVTIIKDRQLTETRGLLVSAGYRGRDAVVVFSFFKLMAPLVALAGAGLYVFGTDPIGHGRLLDIAAVAAAALAAGRLPDLVLKRRRKARLESIRRGLPDALDMVVICAEAGLASDAALKRVVAEIGRRSSALGEELQQTVLELTFLPERRVALENFAERAPIPSVQAFANTLIQAERYGTPLSRAFKVLSTEQRAERMMRAEEKAGRLPATMTVPMMLFILPALFIVLIGPAALDIMDNFVGLEH